MILLSFTFSMFLLSFTFSMMGDGFEHRAAGFLLKKELTYFSKVSIIIFS